MSEATEYIVKTSLKEQKLNSSNSEEHTGVSRREVIHFFALGCAGLLSTNALADTPGIARVAAGPVRKGQLLSSSQMNLLRELTEVIIPETDTPGAASTDTHGFIDDQLANCRAPDESKRFVADLDRVGTSIRQHWGKFFPELEAEEKLAVMNAIALGTTPFDEFGSQFFYKLKSLTIIAYYSSEAGAKQELVYLPVPGGYRGDFKLSENGGRAFSPPVF